MNHELIMEIGPITKEQLVKYANASGDYNPIHLDEESAKELGHSGVIAHGMLTMGLMAKPFSETIRNGAFIQDMIARFKTKVYEGDRLTVTAMLESKHNNLIEYYVQVRNQSGILAAEGKVILKYFSSFNEGSEVKTRWE